jgi:hypothetical protein
MKSLITSKHKHLLYKDELNDIFILTKYLEIYRKSKTLLGCCCWSFKILVKLRSMGLILNEWSTSDGLYLFDTNCTNLEALIQCGAQKRRVYRNGSWLKSREYKLAHRIIPFNPQLSS